MREGVLLQELLYAGHAGVQYRVVVPLWTSCTLLG